MKHKLKIYTFSLFFITLVSIVNVPNVNAVITETMIVYDGDTSVLGTGSCYFGWDGLRCTHSDWLNTTFTSYSLMPSLFNGNKILSYNLINASVLTFAITDINIVTNLKISLNNWSGFNEETYEYNYDREILNNYPPTFWEYNVLYNASLTDYMHQIPLWDLTRNDNDLNSNQIAYVPSIRIELNASESYGWSIEWLLIYFVEITYNSGGWDEFTEQLINFVPETIIYLALIWIFGSKYGYMGGGFASILGALIIGALGDDEALPFIVIMLGLGILFFLAEYKKNNGLNRLNGNSEL